MMSFLFCHECYSWVQPHNDRCPHCMAQVDSDVSDPPLHQLRESIGDLVARLGEIRISRRPLPALGILYATSKGLYFLPHWIEKTSELKEEQVRPSFLWHILARIFFPPLGWLLPFWSSKKLRRIDFHTARPQMLTPSESELLPQLLMDNLGAFFVPVRIIRLMTQKGDRWLIDRFQGTSIVFKPEADPPRFHDRLRQLMRSPEWQHTTFDR